MRRSPRAIVLALIGLLVLAAAAAALVLSVPGLRLTLVPTQPTTSVSADPLGTRLALGAAVAVDEVADLAPGALGLPDEAYVIDDGAITSLVYAAGDGLPELDGTDIGLLIQAFDGALDREQVEKLVGRGRCQRDCRQRGRSGRLLDRRPAAPAPLPRPGR